MGCAEISFLDITLLEVEGKPETKEELIMAKYQWFGLCDNEATTTRPAPNLDHLEDSTQPTMVQVPICSRCDDKLNRIKALNQRSTNA